VGILNIQARIKKIPKKNTKISFSSKKNLKKRKIISYEKNNSQRKTINKEIVAIEIILIIFCLISIIIIYITNEKIFDFIFFN